MALLTVNNLAVGYETGVVAKDISFELQPGDYLCIVGENGSGKTTLMKTLLGLQEPMDGEIIACEDLRRGKIGYLPQQTRIQKDFPASVREVVLSGCMGRLGRRPFYGRQEKQLAQKNMERMGIADFSNRCYRDLSGGQQQRVLLARALCAAEKVLLLDEPVSGLDPVATAEMYGLIEKLNREGITIIMISHDISAAIHSASHILHVARIAWFGTKEDYRSTHIGQKFLGQGEGRA